MTYLQDGYRGIWFLVRLNFDRLFFIAVLFGALAAAGYIAHP